MKIAVYVGSFNPVHKGHIKVVKKILKEYVDKVIIVPTMSYWNKNNLISISDRINMLKLYETKYIVIDIKNNNYEFTYQVLRNIQKEYKNDKIYLVIGDDLLKDFDKWKNISEILKYNIIVIKRNNIDESIYKKYEKYNFIVTNKISSKEISSTIVRNMIANGNKDVLKYIDLKVYDYIKRNNLYVS